MNTGPLIPIFILLCVTEAHLLAEHLAPIPALPAPPQQEAPWSLPKEVPDPEGRIAKAVESLFTLGLADPRGLPYRHLTVREGDEALKARGWVLPSEPDTPKRHAIGWSGLIYPVETVGKPANLEADIVILRDKGWFCEEPFDNYQEETLEDLLAKFVGAPRMMHPWATPYLLLRLGRSIEVSEQDADPFAESNHPEPTADGLPVFAGWCFDAQDGSLLIDFARHLRADGVAAYFGKDDHLASERLRQFDRVWVEIERRFPKDEGKPDENENPFSNASHRHELNSSWRALLADARRRLEARPEAGPSPVAKAIASWDELETFSEEAPPAAFREVIAAGPAAIEPLLDCLENDRRWTRIRSLSGADHSRVLRVRDLAFLALERVLRFPAVKVPYDYAPIEEPWYLEAAATMRAFCAKHQNACGGDLWFRILADAEAELGHQAIAADAIVRPPDPHSYDSISSDFFYLEDAWDRFHDPIASREGEALRDRRDPSVLDLLERAWRRARVDIDQRLAAGEPETNFPAYVCATPITLRVEAHLFVRGMEEWQPGNLEVLREHYNWLAEPTFQKKRDDFFNLFMVSQLCEETLIRRFWSDDETAMEDYVKFFHASLEKDTVPIDVMEALPDIPGMALLAAEAFLGDDAPLSLVSKPWTWADSRESLVDAKSPLLVLPPYRQALIEGLMSRQKQAELTVQVDGATLSFLYEESDNVSTLGKNAALRCAKAVGTTLEVRLCDLVAYSLTPKSGPEVWITPAFHLDDPLATRDSAIADWIKLLEADRP